MPVAPSVIFCFGESWPSLSMAAPDLVFRWQGIDGALPDALCYHVPDVAGIQRLLLDPKLPATATDGAVVVHAPHAAAGDALAFISLGVQDVVVDVGLLPQALRHAIARKRVERAARNAYATDLATGLPHQAQLLEHMTHLLALRQRSPTPMALVVLRVQVASRLPAETGALLRRKVAVRLRGALRAGDVVASLGTDTFGALLGHLEAAPHAQRVAAKLVLALQQPFTVSGQSHQVAVSIGLATVPEHGTDAASLLKRATAQASEVSFGGGADLGQAVQRGLADAANDDGETVY